MELISYAIDFTSFYIQNTKYAKEIKAIILFGSVARKEATKKSDVDLFIDINENQKAVEKEAQDIVEKFYDSIKYKNYWALLGIKNNFSIIVDKIDEWKLKDSMLGNSISLYSPYSPKLDKGTNKTIIYWENIKNNSHRVMLNKKLFGFKHYKLHYKGLIEKYNGLKLGANVILINTEYLNDFLKTLRNFNAKTRIIRVFEYEQ